MNMQRSGEDYLETILLVQEEKGVCRSIDVATRLGFSKPSVSVAVGKLSQDGYLQKAENGDLLLTEKGRVLARATLEKHRLLTRFLIAIGVSPSQAEEDACAMEHSLSEESFEKLLAFQQRKEKRA